MMETGTTPDSPPAKNGQRVALNNKDQDGKSAIHFVVCPIEFGSYENDDLLIAMMDFGFEANLEDLDGKTPYWYACQ
jgi:hypothetical protein